jgi:shikimate kinase
VFLVGFMGAGKTTVGRALARQLGWRFIDLDDHIEARQKRSIAEIFRESGEIEFRRAEATELRNLLADLPVAGAAVVALGGGAFVQKDNARLLKAASAPVVFLDAPVHELWERTQQSSVQRPLANAENHFRQLYEMRRQRYMKAEYRLETCGKTVEQIVGEITASLGLPGVPAEGDVT